MPELSRPEPSTVLFKLVEMPGQGREKRVGALADEVQAFLL